MACLVTVKVSIANVFERSAPARALAWAPFHATANAEAAARLQANAHHRPAQLLAYEALRRDPTRVAALRTLGSAAAAENDRSNEARIMSLSYRLSRRDPLTHVWMVRNALERQNFHEVVHHFDIAMRTTTRAAGPLIAILVATTADPRVLPPLRRLLETNPRWKAALVHGLAASGPRPDFSVMLTRGLLDVSRPDERAAITVFIRSLAQQSRFDLAWQVYRQADRAGAAEAGGLLRNGGFEREGDLLPFDWSLESDPELSAARQGRPDGRGSSLVLTAASGRRGEVARQLVRLPAGTYRLRADWGATPGDPTVRPQIRLTCVNAPAPLIAVRPPREVLGVQRFGAAVAVPANCTWLWLSIHAIGQDSQPEASPWIDNVTVERAS